MDLFFWYGSWAAFWSERGRVFTVFMLDEW